MIYILTFILGVVLGLFLPLAQTYVNILSRDVRGRYSPEGEYSGRKDYK